jgi:hypothetical protein
MFSKIDHFEVKNFNVKFKDRPLRGKIERLLYRTLRIFYVSTLYYFQPFIGILYYRSHVKGENI